MSAHGPNQAPCGTEDAACGRAWEGGWEAPGRAARSARPLARMAGRRPHDPSALTPKNPKIPDVSAFEPARRRRLPRRAALPSELAIAGSPPRASGGKPTTAFGKETAAGDRSTLVGVLTLSSLQQPTWWHDERHTTCVAGNPSPKPCWCAATPLSPSSGAAAARARVPKASGRRPRPPVPLRVPLTGDDHGFQVRGRTWGTVSRQGSAPVGRLQIEPFLQSSTCSVPPFLCGIGGGLRSGPALRLRPFLGTAACRALFRQGPSARRLLTEASPPGTPLTDATGGHQPLRESSAANCGAEKKGKGKK